MQRGPARKRALSHTTLAVLPKLPCLYPPFVFKTNERVSESQRPLRAPPSVVTSEHCRNS